MRACSVLSAGQISSRDTTESPGETAGQACPTARRDLERAKGIEPSTPSLGSSCSSTELHPQCFEISFGYLKYHSVSCPPHLGKQGLVTPLPHFSEETGIASIRKTGTSLQAQFRRGQKTETFLRGCRPGPALGGVERKQSGDQQTSLMACVNLPRPTVCCFSRPFARAARTLLLARFRMMLKRPAGFHRGNSRFR